jgi:hypothetical protein
MTFTSGTSESNLGGISIGKPSSFNTFIGTDLEANSANSAGVDINDGGASTYFRNIISSSTCNSCSAVMLSNYWSVIEGGYLTTTPGGAGLNWWNHNGNVIETALVVNGGLASRVTTNNVGFQLVTAPGCTITPGAIGNSCLTSNIFFPVDENDSNARIVCTLEGGSGVNTLGNIAGISHSAFVINEIAMSTTATGGGTITCMVGHN